MRYLAPVLFIACLFLSACGSEGDCQNPPNTDGVDASETTDDNNETADTDETNHSNHDDSERVGSSATSCGDPIQGLEPVDCTMHGDTAAFCVYGNHCYCNRDAGFQCEAPLMDDWDECAPGSVCVPIEE